MFGLTRLRRYARAGLACLGVALAFASQGASLDADAQQRIRAATFEVVQLKPPEAVLEYERPLPMDLIPFQERNDKYRSVGTAFALGGNRYVTAGHVIVLGMGSQYGPPALRDAAGNVYSIDQVFKYDDRRDYVVFSLRSEPKSAQSLATGAKPMPGDVVYAVGNALGEGVVIRDGSYTSDTPEEMEGQWKWLRFSAAASPGNSGGPLVDQSGHAIGVVLRKSEAENLNYALPIDEVINSKDGQAQYVSRAPIRVGFMDVSETLDVNEHFPLPKSLSEFYSALLALTEKVIIGGQRTLLSHNAARLFPNSPTSERVLNLVDHSPFPHTVVEGKDGNWVVAGASNVDKSQLDQNGYVQTAGGYLRLRLPDNVALAAVNADSKQFMDLILKGYTLRRQVGSDSVRVTSLGKAQQESGFTDSYGRNWQVRIWNVPYSDSVLLTSTLTVPGGFVGALISGRASFTKLAIEEQQMLADHIYVSMEGTLTQWLDYQKLRGAQPKLFDDIKLEIEPQRSLRLRTKRLEMAATPELISLAPDSELSLNFSFFHAGGSIVWDIGSVTLTDGQHRGNEIAALRVGMPPASLPDDFQHRWSHLTAHDYPFNSMTFKTDGGTRIRTAAGSGDDAALRYALTVSQEGDQPQELMAQKLTLLQSSFKVLEK